NVVRRALLEGLEQGREEGLQRGLQQGQAQGEQQRSRDIARSLLGLLPPETIAEKTGLTVAEVEALADPTASPDRGSEA
ncbi:MAG: Rpn family recombination-promoting nuclease/putative transposase, partial [Prochlorothrix sp.]